jgi:hypothetical protein
MAVIRRCIMVGNLAVRMSGGEEKFLHIQDENDWRLPTPKELEEILVNSHFWSEQSIIWGLDDSFDFWTDDVQVRGLNVMVTTLRRNSDTWPVKVLSNSIPHVCASNMRHLIVCESKDLRGTWQIF